MKSILLFAHILIILFIAPIMSGAQEKFTADSAVKERPIEKKSYGLVSPNYSSDLVFLGRKSTVKTPYLSAFAGYYHTSGFFINGVVSYLAASGGKRIDLFTATITNNQDTYKEDLSNSFFWSVGVSYKIF